MWIPCMYHGDLKSIENELPHKLLLDSIDFIPSKFNQATQHFLD